MDILLKLMMENKIESHTKNDKYSQYIEDQVNDSINVDFVYFNNNNKLLSPSLLKAKLKEEYMAAVQSVPLERYAECAVGLLLEEGKTYWEKWQFEEIKAHLAHAKQCLDNEALNDIGKLPLVKILKIPESTTQAFLQMAISKFNEGRFSESVSLFFFLTMLDPDDSDYWYGVGISAQKEGDLELAIKAFTIVIDLDPEFIGSRLFLSYAYLQQGDLASAKATYQEAINICSQALIDEDFWEPIIKDLDALITKAH